MTFSDWMLSFVRRKKNSMPYDPTIELDSIRALLGKADRIMDKLKHVVPSTPRNEDWFGWRVKQHQMRLEGLHNEVHYLVNEIQDAFLRDDSVLLRFHHSTMVEVDYRGVNPELLPFEPLEGTAVEDLVPPKHQAEWNEMFRVSQLEGTSRLQFNARTLSGVEARFYVRCNWKGGDFEERHVYVRPSRLAEIGKVRRPKKVEIVLPEVQERRA